MFLAGAQSRKPQRYLRALALAALLLGATRIGGGALPQAARHVSLTLLSTTDLHGHILPEDDVTGEPANQGLAKIATLVRGIRAQHPHVMLLDCGDTIQGNPLAYFAVRMLPKSPNPSIAAMNELNYTAMAVGNHEFNFGLEVLAKVRREAKFPFLAANLLRTGDGDAAAIEPYVIRNLADVRVGIVGFVTPGVPEWELPENYRGYEFEGIVHAARRVIPEVRAKSDLVVVIIHSGFEGQPSALQALAESVPGIDVIFFGHSHRELSGKYINGVVLAQARNWGRSLAETDVEMDQSAEGVWKVGAKVSRTIPVTAETAADPQIVAIAKPAHDASQTWLESTVFRSPVDLDTATARIEARPVLAMIHDAQMRAGEADVSLATAFNTRLRIPAGPVTMRQIFALYPYENTLFTVEMTGAQLREALEHAASFYPAWPARGASLHLPEYDADTAAGVNYIIDLTQPVGRRIRELTFQGSPLAAERKLRVAVNHYRYYGGGGYMVYRGLPVIRRSTAGIRELLVEYARGNQALLSGDSKANWRIEPREAVEALRAEARR